jgi:hypothetical protein
MHKGLSAAIITGLCFAGSAPAKKPRRGAWDVIRTTDPIIGASTCVVAALDYVGKDSFSRMGMLYPVVENNPVHGLLIGISSGGKFRLPTGDIVWRVDDRPFRELKAEDNPATGPAPVIPAASDPASKAMQDTLALTMKMTVSMTATSTMASGDRAKSMLEEMLAGKALIFRSAAVTTAYGLQNNAMYRVGQVTEKGLRPIPIDESFRQGLATCRIAPASSTVSTPAP